MYLFGIKKHYYNVSRCVCVCKPLQINLKDLQNEMIVESFCNVVLLFQSACMLILYIFFFVFYVYICAQMSMCFNYYTTDRFMRF